jgi:DNA-binding HxlR family transcriptional regulator
LHELRADGFILRRDHQTVPPRVDYSLTDEGRTLAPLLEALADWGKGKTERAGGKMLVVQEVSHGKIQAKSL